MPETKWLYVVVFTLGGREVGLLSEVVDVHTTSASIDGTLFRQSGVMGWVWSSRTRRHAFWIFTILHQQPMPTRVVHNEHAGADNSQAETVLLAEGYETSFARG